MPKTTSVSDNARICAAALRLAATVDWEKTTLDAVAKAAKIVPATLKKRFAIPCDLVPIIAEEIDREAFKAAGKISGTPHDVLFDLLMVRFDVMQKNRKAVLSMESAARRDRNLACALACATWDGAYRIVDAAKLTTPPRVILAAGLAAVYTCAFIAWRKDESRDMAKTMATLDRALRWAGKAAELLTPLHAS
jgi:AcrR family transcriptional regulator